MYAQPMMVYSVQSDRIIMAKSRRASDEVVEVDESFTGKRASGVSVVLKNKDVKGDVKKIFSLIFFFIVMILFISFSLYLCLSATLMNFNLNDNGKVSWNLYGIVQNRADADVRYITASATTTVPQDLAGRAIQSIVGVKDPFTAEVISDKFDSVSSKDNKIYINNKETNYKGTIKPKKLDEEYLVKCVEGNCKKNEYFIVKKENIVGNLYGYLSFKSGFEEMSSKNG